MGPKGTSRTRPLSFLRGEPSTTGHHYREPYSSTQVCPVYQLGCGNGLMNNLSLRWCTMDAANSEPREEVGSPWKPAGEWHWAAAFLHFLYVFRIYYLNRTAHMAISCCRAIERELEKALPLAATAWLSRAGLRRAQKDSEGKPLLGRYQC